MSTREDLARWLPFLGTPDCSCPYEWRDRNRLLFGVPLGIGWDRKATDPNCPHHARERADRIGGAT